MAIRWDKFTIKSQEAFQLLVPAPTKIRPAPVSKAGIGRSGSASGSQVTSQAGTGAGKPFRSRAPTGAN